MSYLYYVLPATVTLLIALYAFFRDKAASKASGLNWAFVIVTGVLWPITLPFIIWKKLSSLFSQEHTVFTFRPHTVIERQSHTI